MLEGDSRVVCPRVWKPRESEVCDEGILEGRTLTRESNSEHTASLKTSNIPFAWFLKE